LLFIDLENYSLRTKADVEAIHIAIEQQTTKLGKRVNVVVNYDGCAIDEQIANDYVAMVRHLEETYYNSVLRYSSSVFTRVKLGIKYIEKGKVPNLFKG